MFLIFHFDLFLGYGYLVQYSVMLGRGSIPDRNMIMNNNPHATMCPTVKVSSLDVFNAISTSNGVIGT
jgi:hypothetical protein